jgi:hypothetical protein
VPGREPECYCGVKRSEAPAAWRGEPEARPARGFPGAIVFVLAAAVGVGMWAAMRDREPPATPAVESPASPDPSAATPPATAEAAPTESRAVTTTTLAAAMPARAAPAPPAETRPAAPPDTSPSPTAMEEAWARAQELLDRPLRQIAAETSTLQQDCATFAYKCLTSTEGNCLAAMKTAPLVNGAVPFAGNVVVDCEGAKRKLVARGDALKAQLDALETQSRQAGVLPGHWRQLRSAQGLDVWDRY